MDFSARTALDLGNRWRGFQPWPGAFTMLDGKKLIVHRLRIAEKAESGAPGEVRVEGHRMLVACAAGTWLELIEVQLEGKKRLGADEFLRGVTMPPGTRLG
jgi:methionyl-tRNA formyltransferase